MNESLIMDGPGFGELLRHVRWEKGLTEKGLAQRLQESYPKALPLKRWVEWVKQAEDGLIENVDVDHVLTVAMALEVPMSALLPATKPSSLEEVGPTVRQQLLALGMSEDEVCAFNNVLNLDDHDPVIVCFRDSAEDEEDLWDRDEP